MIDTSIEVPLYGVRSTTRALWRAPVVRLHADLKCRYLRQANAHSKVVMPLAEWWAIVTGLGEHRTGVVACRSCGKPPGYNRPIRGSDIRAAWRAVAKQRWLAGDREGARRARMAAAVIR